MRKFTAIDAAQRSPEWYAARVGRLTGSVAGDMMATLRSGGEAAARRDLRLRLVCERLTGQPQEDDFLSADMKRGLELESEAFAVYEARTGHVVRRSGFLSHGDLLIGCSLDGHVGDFDGIIELKAPRSATHLRYLRAGGVPAEHRFQVVHNLFVSGAAWCDFASYDPRFPSSLQLLTVRVTREAVDLAAYELAARLFLSEVENEYAEVARMAEAAMVAA